MTSSIFKGLQDIVQKTRSKEPVVTPTPKRKDVKLTAVKSAKELLDREKRQKTISQLPNALSLSKEDFEVLCTPVINQFVEFIQDLPETRHSFYSNQGGLFDHGVERSLIAIQLCREIFLPSGTQDSPLSQPQCLWAYAMFTAALLRDLGKICVDFQINMYNEERKLIRDWQPFEGSLVGQAAFYNYQFQSDYPESFKCRANILLARQLMPEAGFNWISSDKDVLNVWLAILHDDEGAAGTLGAILNKAHTHSIIHYLLNMPNHQQYAGFDSPFAQDATHDIDALKHSTIGAGIDFIKWLHKDPSKLAKLPHVPGGILIGSNIFKEFKEDKSAGYRDKKNVTWKTVQQSFMGLKIHKSSDGKQAIHSFKNLDKNTEHKGLLVNESYLKPMSKKFSGQPNLAFGPQSIALSSKAQTARYAKITPHKSIQHHYVNLKGKMTTEAPKSAQKAPSSDKGKAAMSAIKTMISPTGGRK